MCIRKSDNHVLIYFDVHFDKHLYFDVHFDKKKIVIIFVIYLLSFY